MRYLDIRIVEQEARQLHLFEPTPEKVYMLVDDSTDKPLRDGHGQECRACSIAEAERMTQAVLMPRLRKMLSQKRWVMK